MKTPRTHWRMPQGVNACGIVSQQHQRDHAHESIDCMSCRKRIASMQESDIDIVYHYHVQYTPDSIIKMSCSAPLEIGNTLTLNEPDGCEAMPERKICRIDDAVAYQNTETGEWFTSALLHFGDHLLN